MERSKVTFSVAVLSQLHNSPPHPDGFLHPESKLQALLRQEATCLGSGRPVHTGPRLLSHN